METRLRSQVGAVDELGARDVDESTVDYAFGPTVGAVGAGYSRRDLGPLDDGHVGMWDIKGRTIGHVNPERLT